MVPWATQLPRGHIHKAGAKPKSHSMPDREETLDTVIPSLSSPFPSKRPELASPEHPAACTTPHRDVYVGSLRGNMTVFGG